MKTFKNIQLVLTIISILTLVSLSSFKTEKNNKASVNKSTHISGSVIDEISGETLVGVEVKLEGTAFTTYTDFDGNFKFKNIKEGSYSIKADLISYKSVNVKQVKVKSGDNKNINVKMKMTK